MGVVDIQTHGIVSTRRDWPWATLAHRLATLNPNSESLGQGLQMMPHAAVGGAEVGDGALFGMNAVVMPGL